MIVKGHVLLRGDIGSEECVALVDTGASMTVIDRGMAERLGATCVRRKRSLVSATGHRLEGEVAILRELMIEGETLDYEKVLVVELGDEVKTALRKLDLCDSLILGVTTAELANSIPDTSTGRLRKVEAFLFQEVKPASAYNPMLFMARPDDLPFPRLAYPLCISLVSLTSL